jgi:hypothetical protein
MQILDKKGAHGMWINMALQFWYSIIKIILGKEKKNDARECPYKQIPCPSNKYWLFSATLCFPIRVNPPTNGNSKH